MFSSIAQHASDNTNTLSRKNNGMSKDRQGYPSPRTLITPNKNFTSSLIHGTQSNEFNLEATQISMAVMRQMQPEKGEQLTALIELPRVHVSTRFTGGVEEDPHPCTHKNLQRFVTRESARLLPQALGKETQLQAQDRLGDSGHRPLPASQVYFWLEP